jgi:hypothetical protein
MSETISGFHNAPQTLNPGTLSVAVIGTVEANGSFTTTEPFLAEAAAAIYAPASGNFTIVNSGLVVETGTHAISYTDAGIFLGAEGSIDNHGSILSDSRSGVALYRGGSLSNSGRIEGFYTGVIAGGVAFISNSGAIISDAPSNRTSSGEGILLDEGRVLTNAASGTVSGDIGFFGAGIGVSTIDNFGTIEGSTAAIYFAGVASALIEHQGAVIDGAITDAQGDGYLELATGTASSGSIASFSGFQTLQVDSGANWELLGSNSFAAYDTIINNGTLRETSADVLTINGTLTGVGEIILDSTTITLNGSVGAGQKLSFSGSGDVLNLGNSAVISSSTGYGIYLNDGASLNNAGRISGYGDGLVEKQGVAINSGTIIGTENAVINGSTYGNVGAFLLDGTRLTNAATGTIAGDFGVTDESDSTIDNSGTILSSEGAVYFVGTGDRLIERPGAVLDGLVYDGTDTGILELGKGSGTGTIGFNAGIAGFSSIVVDTGAKWDFTGNFAASGVLLNEGTISETTGDSPDIGAAISGAGEILLNSASISLYGSVAAGQTVSFAGGGDLLELGNAVDFHGTIANFGLGDSIVLLNPASDPQAEFAGGVLTLVEASSTTALTFASPSSFANGLSIQGEGPLETAITITVTCFVSGTNIATPDGEAAVQSLEIGDEIRTLHAGNQKIKWIGRRSYDGKFIRGNRAALPIRIRQNAIAENVPARDLWVSPGHAISIDGVLIHAARLINGVSVIQAASVDEVSYFHIELENHEILLAENCPAESFMGEHFRQQFHNVADFGRRYPGEIAPAYACQPRLDHGFQLHAIQRRINARAGIKAPTVTGPLRGFVDRAGPCLCFGWAQDAAAPEEPVCLDILSGDKLLGRVLANLYRADVAAAGFGSGYQGFEFPLPMGLVAPIEVRRSFDRAKLEAAALALAS